MLHAGDPSDPPVQQLERVERRPCGRPGPLAVAWRQMLECRPVRAPSAPRCVLARVRLQHAHATALRGTWGFSCDQTAAADLLTRYGPLRSEERRVGKECRSRW